MPGERSTSLRVLACTAGLGLLVSGGQAHAYCREVTGVVPPNYDPSDAGCYLTDRDSGAVLPQLFWRNQCVQFNLNRNGTIFFPLATARQIAVEAFAQWNTASCAGGVAPSINATEGPQVDCSDISAAHNNPIIFRDTGWTHTDRANAIGYTTLTVELDTGEILGAEIEVNTENHLIVATIPPPVGAYDLPSILTHEAGHFLGLAHSDQSSAVMYAYYHPFFQANGSNLTPDDVAGICAIYPSDGSRTTQAGVIAGMSCKTDPLLGFEDLCGTLDAAALPSNMQPPQQSEGDAGTAPLNETLFGCAVERAPGRPSGAAALAVLAASGLLARRERSRERRGNDRLRSRRSR